MNYGELPAHSRAHTRENLQNLFDRAFISGDKVNLREHYRALRNIEFSRNPEKTNEQINISALAENLTIACDILTADTGVNFIFCGNDTSFITGNGQLLTKAILSLLSNAYLHGKGRLVTVKTVENAEYIKIEVKNEGTFKSQKFGKGLLFVHKVCSLCGGFFIETDLFTTTAVILIKKVAANNCNNFYVPDFCEYLSDRLSPVYVEMFGMEYRS